MTPVSCFRLALRNVRRNSRRSLLTVLAIAFGLFCLIVFQALKVGLHREMILSTVALDTGSLQVHAPGYEPNLATLKPLPRPEEVLQTIGKSGFPAAAPRLKAPGLLLAAGRSTTVLLSGVDPDRERRVTFIAERLVAGRYLGSEEGFLMGSALAESLGIALGDEVTVMLQGAFGIPVTQRLPVTGIYRTALTNFDRTHAFLPLPRMQTLLQAEGAVTEIAVRVADGERETAARLREVLPAKDYRVRVWQELVPDVVQLIELNDATMHLLILIVFAIVALGIANTMMMVVYERFREIGILSAIGTSPGDILALVLAESLCIGVAASLIGSLLGIAACAWLARHGLDLTSMTSANIYFANSHVLKARLLSSDLAAANLITLFTALLSGIYPAWKASRLQPAEAIRHV